jgi:hypothetical protein
MPPDTKSAVTPSFSRAKSVCWTPRGTVGTRKRTRSGRAGEVGLAESSGQTEDEDRIAYFVEDLLLKGPERIA